MFDFAEVTENRILCWNIQLSNRKQETRKPGIKTKTQKAF